MTRLAAPLAAHLRRVAKQQPAAKLAFIVTLAPGHAARAVLPCVPTIEVELIRMAAGTMTAAEALALADDARVERIELDGEAQALASNLGEAEDEPND